MLPAVGYVDPKYNELILYLVTSVGDNLMVTDQIGRGQNSQNEARPKAR